MFCINLDEWELVCIEEKTTGGDENADGWQFHKSVHTLLALSPSGRTFNSKHHFPPLSAEMLLFPQT